SMRSSTLKLAEFSALSTGFLIVIGVLPCPTSRVLGALHTPNGGGVHVHRTVRRALKPISRSPVSRPMTRTCASSAAQFPASPHQVVQQILSFSCSVVLSPIVRP